MNPVRSKTRTASVTSNGMKPPTVKKSVPLRRSVFPGAAPGYTVIEMLVSAFVFVVVVSLAVGTFIHSLRTQKETLALMAMNDNASLVLEQITRELRVGANFVFQMNRIDFTSQNNQRISYQQVGDAILRSVDAGSLLPLTSRNVLVQYLNFENLGNTTLGEPKRITIAMRILSPHPRLAEVVTTMQTTVTVRE